MILDFINKSARAAGGSAGLLCGQSSRGHEPTANTFELDVELSGGIAAVVLAPVVSTIVVGRSFKVVSSVVVVPAPVVSTVLSAIVVGWSLVTASWTIEPALVISALTAAAVSASIVFSTVRPAFAVGSLSIVFPSGVISKLLVISQLAFSAVLASSTGKLATAVVVSVVVGLGVRQLYDVRVIKDSRSLAFFAVHPSSGCESGGRYYLFGLL